DVATASNESNTATALRPARCTGRHVVGPCETTARPRRENSHRGTREPAGPDAGVSSPRAADRSLRSRAGNLRALDPSSAVSGLANGGVMFAKLHGLLETTRGLLLVGLAIREALSFWTGHPYDMEVWLRNAYFVSQGADPDTDFLPPVPGLSFAFLTQRLGGACYLPLWPRFVAGLYRVYAALPGGSRV